MGYAQIQSIILLGIKPLPITVEVHIAPGLPQLELVGLPSALVRESKARIRSAITQSGFSWPLGRITINLTPADLPKSSPDLDLPMAVGILIAANHLDHSRVQQYVIAGSLSLSGDIRVAPMLLLALYQSSTQLLTGHPPIDTPCMHSITSKHYIGAKNLNQLIKGFTEPSFLEQKKFFLPNVQPYAQGESLNTLFHAPSSLKSIKAALAGRHHLLLYGPPGVGKTSLAETLPCLYHFPGAQTLIENALIQEGAANVGREHDAACEAVLFHKSPTKASPSALVGSHLTGSPGLMAKAHGGLLIMDEFLEHASDTLETLRQVMDTKTISLHPRKGVAQFPADFQLIACTNACPCGYLGSPDTPCRCTSRQKQLYANRLSGPLLSRIDIATEILPPTPSERKHPLDIYKLKHSIQACQNAQIERQGRLNSACDRATLLNITSLTQAQQTLLDEAATRWHLDMRCQTKVLAISRTLADLEQRAHIDDQDLFQAIQWQRVSFLPSPAEAGL